VVGHARTRVVTVNEAGPSCPIDQGANLKYSQLRFLRLQTQQTHTISPMYSYESTFAALPGKAIPNVNPPRVVVVKLPVDAPSASMLV
jgi:hypothetical protein